MVNGMKLYRRKRMSKGDCDVYRKASVLRRQLNKQEKNVGLLVGSLAVSEYVGKHQKRTRGNGLCPLCGTYWRGSGPRLPASVSNCICRLHLQLYALPNESPNEFLMRVSQLLFEKSCTSFFRRIVHFISFSGRDQVVSQDHYHHHHHHHRRKRKKRGF